MKISKIVVISIIESISGCYGMTNCSRASTPFLNCESTASFPSPRTILSSQASTFASVDTQYDIRKKKETVGKYVVKIQGKKYKVTEIPSEKKNLCIWYLHKTLELSQKSHRQSDSVWTLSSENELFQNGQQRFYAKKEHLNDILNYLQEDM